MKPPGHQGPARRGWGRRDGSGSPAAGPPSARSCPARLRRWSRPTSSGSPLTPSTADAFDECRRRVQHGASGRRGRKDEPLHQARSALRTGAGSFTGKARLQALFADERHPGVEVTGHPPADGAAHRGPGTLVMRSDQALEREEPVRRSMRALLTNHEILVAFPGQHLHVSCAARSSPPGPHQPPPSWPYRCRDVSHCFERWGEKATSGAWDVGRARGRGSGPGPCRVFVGAGRARDHGPLTDGGRAANLLFYPDSSQSC